ncbi:MAG: ZIP family metal transporter [Thermoplasmataceae archaeon]
MNGPLTVLLLSAIMGLSILITLPLVIGRRLSATKAKFLGAVAVGILIFLVADLFTDSAGIMYNGSIEGYGTNAYFDLVFTLSLVSGFFLLFLAESRTKSSSSPYKLSLFIAIGIGFQNLSEGLVFGSSYNSIGLVGVTLVILAGFILQNITEGFPIASPFIGKQGLKVIPMVLLFLLGGVPTIIGGGAGYFYSSTTLNLVFDGIAIGTMFYVILPILRSILKDTDASTIKLVYIGSFLGFLLGFFVNLI